MKFSALLFTALLSSNVFAAVDYSYCQKQFNQYKQSNKPCKETISIGLGTACKSDGKDQSDSSYYPFELTADGKIKPHPLLNYKNENGKEIISSKDNGMIYETVITRNDKGEIASIDSNFTMKQQYMYGGGYGIAPQVKTKEAPFARKSETNTKIEIKNGKCIPSRVDTVNSLGDESRQDVNFDAKLCHNVQQFFKKNPEAASCFDKGLMDKAQSIFGDYYKDNKDLYGDVDTNNLMNKPKPQRTKLKSDMNQGMGMYGGYGYPGSGYNGASGVGLGMPMMGATTEQMLTPMMPSIDSVLSTNGFYQSGFGGFGNSPVVQAMQIMTLCQGGGFGPNVLHDLVNDESVWKSESSSSSKDEAASTISK